jgi:hypothetical protein
MSDDPTPEFDIIEERGSFLLIRAGSRFAVVERRAGRVYPMMPGEREGEPITAEGMAKVMAEEGWLAEPEAQHPGRSSRPRPSVNQPAARISSAEAHASQVCRISSGVWASDT